MTGYRVFNRRFVKSIPILSSGFQVETEMTIFALDKKYKIIEVPIDFQERPEGSFSKLNTFTDGRKVLWEIFSLFRHYKPLPFFFHNRQLIFYCQFSCRHSCYPRIYAGGLCV